MNKSQERSIHENCKRGGNSRSIFGQALARFGAKDDLVLNRHRQVSQFTTTNLGIIETNLEIPKFLHVTLFIYDFNTLTVKHSSNYETERSNKVRSSLIFLESFTFFNIRYSISEDVFPTSASKRLWKWTRQRFVSWLRIENADATYALPTN